MNTEYIPLKTVRGLDGGPLVAHVGAYIDRARHEGYPARTVLEHVRLVASLNQHLIRTGRNACELDEALIARFLRRDPRARRSPGAPVTIRRLLTVLRDAGAVAPAVTRPASPTPAQQLTDEFRTYLRKERGLSRAAIYGYALAIDSFLTRRFGLGKPSCKRLTGEDVTDFLRWEIKRRQLHHTSNLLAGMRAFLRFLHACGRTKIDLSPVVPREARWSLSGLPKNLPPGAATKVLAACDRRRARGRRDYAMLMLLARLGLRGGEVLSLTLDDIDWEHGRILVRSGKGPGNAHMPLPHDVGQAIAAYLREDRPACASRRVFLRMIAPHAPLSQTTAVLSVIVGRYFKAAGVAAVRKGAHAFRHTLATDMLRDGASLDEIGQVLRHTRPESTMIYAKVDVEALRELALPWPGGVS